MSAPVVLFACIHNSGRSVAARVLTEHYAQGTVEARSAGSEPKGSVNPVVAEVLAERGLSTDRETATLLEPDVVSEWLTDCLYLGPYRQGTDLRDEQLRRLGRASPHRQ